MEPVTSTIKYQDPHFDVDIVVRQATAMDGMRRSAFIGQVIAKTKSLCESQDAAELMEGMNCYYLGLAWAGCRATLHGVTLNDTERPGRIPPNVSFDDFSAYPDAMVQLWEEVCLTLNPQWAPKLPDDLGGSRQPENTSSES